jgi:hypothetical protein
MVPKLRTSPRARRRALTVLWVVAAIGVLAGASRLLPDGKELDVASAPAGPAIPERPTPAPPKPVPLRTGERRAIDEALDRFVPAAVKRRDPGLAYELVTPALRAGTTRADWATGTIPVQPFPARGRRFHQWTLSYSYRNHVGLELLLESTEKKEVGAIAFAVDMKRLRGRWLVDSFIPAAVFAGAGAPPRISAVPDFGPTGGTRAPSEGRLDPIWFLVPAAVFALGFGALIAVGTMRWLRGRRAVRAYEAGRQDVKQLPPLPAPTRSRVALARAGRNR